ncbi:TetR/AcrR family transcriptional regulator [Mycobacterium simiae]|uniref:TetR/AcrR family transcriptional regulator n=1 Tax=Mycobacterium simiae TaxID=1784 RepID=A0A5B1BT45_MYCSI|nr:TetR family transcriptional regulator [Mycobacterium simiae]KAA1250905.1 TetR/AcrR family transcriptional regulator [Mycobacterium simiae]
MQPATRRPAQATGFRASGELCGAPDASTRNNPRNVDNVSGSSVTADGRRRRRGRPPGNNSNTRERILATARELFARNGVDRTSIRTVAEGAEVDAALVHHYFGTKQQLFAAAIRLPIDPKQVLGRMRKTPVEELGFELPSTLLPMWDSELGVGLIATLRSLLAGDEASLAGSFLQEVVTAEVGSLVDNPPGTGRIRAQFVASQLLGVLMARYIVQIEPFASMSAQDIARTIAPTLQRYLTEELEVPQAS